MGDQLARMVLLASQREPSERLSPAPKRAAHAGEAERAGLRHSGATFWDTLAAAPVAQIADSVAVAPSQTRPGDRIATMEGPAELVPIIDSRTHQIRCVAERNWVHEQGL